MKTLLITLEYPPFKGGIASYYSNLLKSWPLNEPLELLDNNKNQLMATSGFFAWRFAFKTIWQRLQKNDISYILVGHILPLGTVTFVLSYLKSFKYAVFLHGLDFNATLNSPRKRFLSALILRRADKIICANNYTAGIVADFYPAACNKIKVVNPGVTGPDDEEINKISNTVDLDSQYNLSGRLVLLSVGRLVRRKGVDYVIKSIAQMSELEKKDLVYFVAGAGPDENYLKSLVATEDKNRIIFLGAVDEKDKWRWLKRADIFIMPARNIKGDVEGFGIVYLEANLMSRPVIAGNSGGVGDAVLDSYNGLLVEAENIASIKAAIIKLAGDAQLRKKLGEQGRERALKEFNWPGQSKKIVDIINTQNL